MSLQEVYRVAEDKMKKTVGVAQHELNNIRTGRASVSLVDEIKVDYYNNPTPLKQLATISTPQPHLIVIQPWDASVIQEIEKAILKSNLGFTPSNDGKIVRISIPQLTTEKRQEMVKLAKKIVEESKVSIRSIRREANESLDKEKKESLLSEDETFKGHNQIQKLTDEYITKLDNLFKEKEREIMEF
jgi:ribosome recycling factor